MDPVWTPPSRIDEFRVEHRLGRGGMGDVWLARDTLLERDVAMKFATEAATDEARLRFRVEARAVARLQHPNIVAVHHAGELADRPFLVTELLRGKSLDRLERLPLERVVAVGADLARALAAAHAAGVIHRDVKPANAFLCDDGAAKLLDFGLAQLQGASTTAGASATLLAAEDGIVGAFDSTHPDARGGDGPVGTPLYMAPETWRGEAATQKTDVYSFGALLFTLLANRPPYPAATLAGLVKSVLSGAPPDLAAAAPGAPAALVRLVLRCLGPEPAKRPSAEQVCNLLEAMRTSDDDAGGAGDPEASPYRGLLPFGGEDRGLFFGREVETAAVLTELRGAPFVLVVGASGAGKSSLVRAGVLPRVLAGALGGGEWRAATMVPGARPLERLAQALSPILAERGEDVAERVSTPGWAAERLAREKGGAGVVLFVDQLEEAWTLAAAPEREALFASLAAFARVGPGVRVVATIRADFLAKLEDLGELRSIALRAPVVLGPLSSEGLRRAIVEPARRRGVEVAPELAERLVVAARGAPGMLPLLEFALAALWQTRDRGARKLAAPDLDALGGLEGALAAHADAVVARFAPRLRAEARRVLLALVTVDRTRARVEEGELVGGSAEARAALEALVDARLVVASAGEESTAYEVAHEVLLSGWPTLRGWLDEESAAREATERLRRAVAEWERLGRGVEALLGERQLEELDVLEGRPLSREMSSFVIESRAAARRLRLRRVALAVGIPTLLVVVAVAGWAVSSARQRAAVSNALAVARALDEKAEATGRSGERARIEALALFDKDDLGPAEERWKQMLALEEDADRQRRDVGVALDLALALGPRDVRTRALYADVTLARLFAAERLHEEARLRELRAQLDVFDDGSRAAALGALAHVRAVTDPPGATLTLARFREDGTGRLVETDRGPLVAGSTRELEPGSYLIVAVAPDRYTTRYPFLARRGEGRALRVVLPPATDVPAGMLYVPAGRTRYGSSDDEETRAFLGHQPIHDIEVSAFLIARTEVTNGAYLEFLGALSDADRVARMPSGLTVSGDGQISWKRRSATLAPGRPYCNGVQPCVDWVSLPVDGASEEDGERYAEWLSTSGRLPGARLCTDREWERAARGADDRLYPSGNGEVGPTDACTLGTYGGDVHRVGPCAVGTHPASASLFGAEDMTGSEWEWTSSTPDVAQPKQRSVRGAGCADYGMFLCIPNRGSWPAGVRYLTQGIRVCADAK